MWCDRAGGEDSAAAGARDRDAIDFHTLSCEAEAARGRELVAGGGAGVVSRTGRAPSSVEGGHEEGVACRARASRLAADRPLPRARVLRYRSLRAQAAALLHEWSPVRSSRARPLLAL